MVTAESSSPDLEHTDIPPIVAATWETPVVDAHRVQKALELLWGQLRIEQGETGGSRGDADEYEQMRASTLNLIVLAGTTEGAQAVHRTIAELTEYCPSRAAILVTDGPDVASDDLTIRAAVHEQPRGKTEQPIRYETITVMANRRRDASLVNIASTLLVPELPDFLWWHAPSIASGSLFDELVSISDRLIVDTANLAHIAEAFPLLARLGTGERPVTRLSDLAWARLTPWRQIVAQFFDPADARACLDTIDEIEIEYGGEMSHLPSGMTTGLLMVGWLATRLGWQSPGELVKTREGWRVTLRAGKTGRRREIILRMKATDDPTSSGILRSVKIDCADPACGSFRVERVDMQCLTTQSQVGDASAMTRMVHTRASHPEDLITDELRMFGRDAVYEDALAFAATLLPMGETEG
ncbi:MAG TPA: glucose-6-phosphate dehydrogenase assembly protein OpcA [Thermomicrobiales bacterium]|nr:glucose-6-phosphate dehydrogenase assembly protein OpcA [Thermomicrobiales bacterium]